MTFQRLSLLVLAAIFLITFLCGAEGCGQGSNGGSSSARRRRRRAAIENAEPEPTYADLFRLVEEVRQKNARARRWYQFKQRLLNLIPFLPYRFRSAPPYNMDYAETEEWLHDSVGAAHNIATLTEIGESYEGRKLWLVEVNKDRMDLPALWVDGGIHAGEHLTFGTINFLINEVLFSESDEAIYLRTNFRIYFMPVVNPDGYEYTLKVFPIWRKNRQPNENSTCIGTDLNRNFEPIYNGNCTRNTDPCSHFYAGPEAFSAPEVRVLASALSERQGIVLYVALHTYGQYFIYASEAEAGSQELQDLIRVSSIGVDALNSVYGNTFTYGTGETTLNYCTPGTARQWMFNFGEVKYSYTVELRPETHPDFFGQLLDPAPAKFLIPFVSAPEDIYPSGNEFFSGFYAMAKAIVGTAK